MFCVFCGAANLDAGRFCRDCGKPLVTETDSKRERPFPQPKPEPCVQARPTSDIPAISQVQPHRKGNRLVVPVGAVLPAYCVKCGIGDVTRASKRFSWPNPGFLGFLFLGLGIILIYLIFAKRVRLLVPLCSLHRNYVKRLKIAAMILLLGCIPVGMALGALVGEPDGAAYGMIIGLTMLLAGLISYHLHSPLQAVHIDSHRAVLKGASEVFLAKLGTS